MVSDAVTPATVVRIARGPWGSNCYAVHAQGRALLVDPGGEVDEILAGLAEHSLDLAGMVATHGHFDHVMAASGITDATGVPLWISAQDEPMLAAANLHSLATGFGRPVTRPRVTRNLDEQSPPDLPFDVVVIDTPGHTPGSRCLRVGDEVFTGDTLLARGAFDSPLPGADPAALERSLAVLGALDCATAITIHPGHGRACALDEALATAEEAR